MGSSSSKAARGAGRKYPARAPSSVITQQVSAKRPQPPPQKPLGGGSKSDAIRQDAMDPDMVTSDFSKRLHDMGIAQPNPTYSPSSTATPGPPQAFETPPLSAPGPIFPAASNNATLSVLESRRKLEEAAEQEVESMRRASYTGRRFLDMRTVADAMQLRGRGVPQAQIEAQLKLRPGVLEKLGRPGVLSHAAPGREQRANATSPPRS